MSQWKYLVKLIVLAVFASLVLSGCETANTTVGGWVGGKTDLKLEIVADESINPDEKDQASPVIIRLYELRSEDTFSRADFIDLYENDAKTLADSLVARQNLEPLAPGESFTGEFVLSEEARYAALFVEFYQYNDSVAKLVFPVSEKNFIRNRVRVKISGNRISLQKK